MYLSKNSRYVLQKAGILSPKFFKVAEKNLNSKVPVDDPTKPPLRLNIPKESPREDDVLTLIETEPVRFASKAPNNAILESDDISSERQFTKGRHEILGKDLNLVKETPNEGQQIETAETDKKWQNDLANQEDQEAHLEPFTNLEESKSVCIIIDFPESNERFFDSYQSLPKTVSDPKDRREEVNIFSSENPSPNPAGEEIRNENAFHRGSKSLCQIPFIKEKIKRARRFEVSEIEDLGTYVFHVKLNGNRTSNSRLQRKTPGKPSISIAEITQVVVPEVNEEPNRQTTIVPKTEFASKEENETKTSFLGQASTAVPKYMEYSCPKSLLKRDKNLARFESDDYGAVKAACKTYPFRLPFKNQPKMSEWSEETRDFEEDRTDLSWNAAVDSETAKVEGDAKSQKGIHYAEKPVNTAQRQPAEKPESPDDSSMYIDVHKLKSKNKQKQQKPKKKLSPTPQPGVTERLDTDAVNFQTTSSYVSFGCESFTEVSSNVGLAFPPLIDEALKNRFRLKKDSFFTDKRDFFYKTWKPNNAPKSTGDKQMADLSENSILFPKKENFDCESLLTGREDVILSLIKNSESKKASRKSEQSSQFSCDCYTESASGGTVDSLTVMKKVREIVQFDLDNAIKIFNNGDKLKEEVSSVVVLNGNNWEVDKEGLVKQTKQREAESELAERKECKSDVFGDLMGDEVSKYLPPRTEIPIEVNIPKGNSVIIFNSNTNDFFIDKEALANTIAQKTNTPFEEIMQTLDCIAKDTKKSGDSILVFDEETQTWKVDFSILDRREQQLRLEKELTERSELILETFEKFEQSQIPSVPMPDSKEKKIFDYKKRQWNDYNPGKTSDDKSAKSKSLFQESNAEEIRKKNSDLYENLFEPKKKEALPHEAMKKAPGYEPIPNPKKSESYLLSSENKSSSGSEESKKPGSSSEGSPKSDSKQSPDEKEEPKPKPEKREDFSEDYWEKFLSMNILPKDISEIKKTPPPPPPPPPRAPLTKIPFISDTIPKKAPSVSKTPSATDPQPKKSPPEPPPLKTPPTTVPLPKEAPPAPKAQTIVDPVPKKSPPAPKIPSITDPIPKKSPPAPKTPSATDPLPKKSPPEAPVPPPPSQTPPTAVPQPKETPSVPKAHSVLDPIPKKLPRVPKIPVIDPKKSPPEPPVPSPSKTPPSAVPLPKDAPLDPKNIQVPPAQPDESKIDEPKFRLRIPFIRNKKSDKKPEEKNPDVREPPSSPISKEDPKSGKTPPTIGSSKPESKKIQDPPVTPKGKMEDPKPKSGKTDKEAAPADHYVSDKIIEITKKKTGEPGAKKIQDTPEIPKGTLTDPKPKSGKTDKEASPADHYVSDKIIEITRNKTGDSQTKIKTSKIETVKPNINTERRMPSQVKEINLNKKLDDKRKTQPQLINEKTSADVIVKNSESTKDKNLYKDFEKYKTPLNDPDYEEKPGKIKSDLASNPNLNKLDNWNKTLVLHDIMKPPENIENWLKDETDKMATLLLKVLQEASDGKPKKKQPLIRTKPDKLGKGNPYDNIRKKQENSPENFLFRVRTVNVALENEKKPKTKGNEKADVREQAKSLPVQPENSHRSPKMLMSVNLPQEGKELLEPAKAVPIILEDPKASRTPPEGSALISRENSQVVKLPLDITEEIPGPEILKKISNTWKMLPILSTQMTVFTLLRVFQLVNLGTLFLNSQSADKMKKNAFSKLFAKYGPIVNVQGPLSGNVILIHHPEHLTSVFDQDLTTNIRSVFDSVEQVRRDTEDGMVSIGISTDWSKPEWNELRKATTDSTVTAGRKYFGVINATSDSLVYIIRNNRNSQNYVSEDFMEEIKRWSLEGLCNICFEKSFGLIEGKSNSLSYMMEPSKMYHALDDATKCLNKCERGFQLWRLMSTPSTAGLSKAYRTLSSILSKQFYQSEMSLKSKRKFLKSKSSLPIGDLTFIESMLLNDGMTLDEATCNLIDIFLIGTNIMNSAMGFLLYNVAQNVKVQMKLSEELKEFLPDKDSPLTYNSLSSMKYLQACLKESLRLHFPIPVFYRLLQNDILVSNYVIPKGTFVVMDFMSTGMKDQIFDEPEKFMPERWLQEERWMQNSHPFTALPLCHGQRAELAKRLVEMQLLTCAAKILRNFQIEYQFGEIQSTNGIISLPNKPLKLSFTEREF